MIVKDTGTRGNERYQAKFEIDIVFALSDQLVTTFDKLKVGPFDSGTLEKLGAEQGVYLLYLDSEVVYVGKANNLRNRLSQHHAKFGGRKNIDLDDMGFKCLYVHRNLDGPK